jgi:hypothetical protein
MVRPESSSTRKVTSMQAIRDLQHEIHSSSGRTAKSLRGSTLANKRAAHNERTITNHESRIAALEELVGQDNARQALNEGASGGDKSFYRFLAGHGVGHDEIVKQLTILHETNDKDGITNEEMFYELFSELGSFKRTTIDRLNEHDESIISLFGLAEANANHIDVICGTGEGKLNLPGRVRNLEDSHREVRQSVESLTERVEKDSFPMVALIIGIFAGLVTFLWLHSITWPKAGDVNVPHKIVVGKVTYTANTLEHHGASWLSFGIVQLGIAIGVGAIVAGMLALFSTSKSKTKTTQKTTEKTSIWRNAKNGFTTGIERARHGRKATSEPAATPVSTERSTSMDDREPNTLLVADEKRSTEHAGV